MNLLTLCVCWLDGQPKTALTAKFGCLFHNIMMAIWALHLQTSVISVMEKHTGLSRMCIEVTPSSRILSLSILPVEASRDSVQRGKTAAPEQSRCSPFHLDFELHYSTN